MFEIKDKFLKGYKFIDLFAGIGGFHYALSSCGATCVFASEWDKPASQTYSENFGITPFGDITKINEEQIPDHDILCGGFPCQAFSISGKQRGFEDTRGTLFFDIARIVKYKKPKILILENVKNLITHNNGKTFKTISEVLKSLGYTLFFKNLNTSNFGLPQHRERIYITAFRNDLDIKYKVFKFPEMKQNSCLNNVLEKNPPDAKIITRNDIQINKKFITTPITFNGEYFPNKPCQIGIVNKGGQGERIYHPIGHAITLSAYGGGVGAKTGLYLIDEKVRKLSVRECARLQGFPESFIITKNKNQAYKQFGNSISIDVLQYILLEIKKIL